MDEPGQDGLAAALTSALPAEARLTPAAVLAQVYAARIDEATHLPLPLEKALDTLRVACRAAENPDRAYDALAKIAATLSAVSVAAELGPKLLSALDALLLTPKSKAMLERKIPGEGKPLNPLDALRGQHDELQARRDRRPPA
jgi:hypothetical protein